MEIEDKANMMLGHVETFIENLYQLRESITKLIEEYGKECD